MQYFCMFGLSYREFYAESAGFYLISKFQVLFEIWPETWPKIGIFGPQKRSILDENSL